MQAYTRLLPSRLSAGNMMLRDPEFAVDNGLYYLDREETFARAGMKTLHYMRAVNKLGILGFEERTTMRELITNQLVCVYLCVVSTVKYCRSCNQILPCDVHENLFIPAITVSHFWSVIALCIHNYDNCMQSQGSREQQAKWLQLANRFSIIGAYAQTELGHGKTSTK